MRTHDELIADLAEMFSAGGPMSDRKAELYLAALGSIPVEHLAVVVDRIISTRMSAFLPTPGEIKDEYVTLVLGPPMPDERLQWCLDKHREMEAAFDHAYFAKPVLERGARVDYQPKPPDVFPDVVTEEAVRLAGWSELIGMDREYRAQYWAKKYATARELVAKRIQSGELRLALPGSEPVRPALKAVS